MASNKIILELVNLSKSFGGIKAVNNVNLVFESKTITGLIGPNGAGKTTIFNLISGLLKPDSGKIFFDNLDITNLKSYQRAQAGIGRLFQDVRVFNKMTCIENVLIAIPHQKGEKIIEIIFDRKRLTQLERQNISKAEELLEFVGLIDKKNELAENLSFGQQKLLAIARLLAADAQLLLLDEPTSGVHPELINKILQLIKKLPERNKTIIFIEHNINVVLDIADWLYLLDEGNVVAFGLPYEVLEDKITKEVYLGV